MIWIAYGMFFALGWKLMTWPLDWASRRLGLNDAVYDRLAKKISDRITDAP
jgi:hypothetical protein